MSFASPKHRHSFSSPDLSVDLTTCYFPQDGDLASSSSTHDRPRPALRRKRRMSYIRATISTHLDASDLSVKSCPDPLREKSLPDLPADSPEQQPAHVVPLGHPSRPYYNAIRKNMSRSATPCSFSRAPTPSPSLGPSPFTTSTPTILLLDADFDGGGGTFGRSSSPSPSISLSPPGAFQAHPSRGFSLSGETELRMALAAQRSTTGRTGDRPEYVFADPPMSRRDAGVRRLKRLGQGIKQLVLRRKK